MVHEGDDGGGEFGGDVVSRGLFVGKQDGLAGEDVRCVLDHVG